MFLVSIIKLTMLWIWFSYIVNFNPFLDLPRRVNDAYSQGREHGVTVGCSKGNLGHRLLDAANIAHCLQPQPGLSSSAYGHDIVQGEARLPHQLQVLVDAVSYPFKGRFDYMPPGMAQVETEDHTLRQGILNRHAFAGKIGEDNQPVGTCRYVLRLCKEGGIGIDAFLFFLFHEFFGEIVRSHLVSEPVVAMPEVMV